MTTPNANMRDEKIDALINAIKNNACIQDIKKLLVTITDINKPTIQYWWGDEIGTNYALIEAVKSQRRDIIEVLFEKGVDCTVAESFYGQTPLAASFRNSSYPEITHLLIERGADVNCDMAWSGTPLMMAIDKDDIDMAELLIKSGAQINYNSPNIDENDCRSSALHEAIFQGNKKMVQLLLTHGAQVDFLDTLGNYPLHEAVEHGYIDIAQMLLDAGADINKCCNWIGSFLHIAVENQDVLMVRFLLEKDINRSVVNWKKETPLDLAEQDNNQQIIELLKV